MKKLLITLGTIGMTALAGFAFHVGGAEAYSYIPSNYYNHPYYNTPYYGDSYYGGYRCHYYGSDGACYNYSTRNNYYGGWDNYHPSYNYHYDNRSYHPYEERDRYRARRTYTNCHYSYCDTNYYWPYAW